MFRILPLILIALAVLLPRPVAAVDLTGAEAAALLGVAGPVQVRRDETGVPGWTVVQEGRVIGQIGSSWDIARTVGYSGRPLDVLVALDLQARVTGARLVRHEEPVLTLGLSDAQISAYVAGFRGLDLAHPAAGAVPDILSRATVSSGVIRDGILRTARTLATARGLLPGSALDRHSYVGAGWADLLAQGALAETRVSLSEAAAALPGAKVPVPQGEGDFLRLWVALIDTPTIGQNLLGQQEFTRAIGALGPGDAGLLILSSGLHSHRGTGWQQTGIFDRLAIVQGDRRWQPTADRYRMIRKLAVPEAPALKEISFFALPAAIDPTRPFRIEVTARRETATRPVQVTIALPYTLPAIFRPAAPETLPLWQTIWQAKQVQAGAVIAILAVLTVILFAQDWIVRRPMLWRRGRLAFLAVSFFGLGLGLNGQLSVVQVVAFVHALLTGFRWETFLIDPVIFLLWCFVALGLLFWGRGVYCGWLCPFGALQELTNAAAQRLGLRQIAVPAALHERLWVIKYTLFVAVLGLSFQSMHKALLLAEVEPFKTAISLRFLRAWPFLAFVGAILIAGLFIERFYCRYLCPLGAGLAIPAKLKVFDWLKRRPQCGRECRLCETKCTVGAIDPLGRINANECVLCLRCQVVMQDATQCPILKRRARSTEGA